METKNTPPPVKKEDYKAIMPEYMYNGDPEKYKFVDKYFGWKIHLNAQPEKVKEVSRFLKEHGYTHKYLSTENDETESGKIFTVYFGPKQLAEESIRDISDNIGDVLSPPIDTVGEQLVAPNIVARFDTDPNSARFKIPFTKHGYYHGIPLLNYYNDENLDESIAQSNEVLVAEFGDFFGGSVETYKL